MISSLRIWLFHFPGRDLTLAPDGAGKKASLDVVAVILDEKGKVVDEFNRTYPIRIPPQGVSTVEKNGIDFSTDMVVKKPGIYTFRLAVRDNNSKKLGSAGDVIDIPDSRKRDFYVSGLVATTVGADGVPIIPAERPANAAFAPVFSGEIPSLRQFRKGTILAFAYSVHNPKFAGGSRSPNLTAETRLYKDGKEIVRMPEKAIELNAPLSGNRIDDYGMFRITEAIETGEYALQVIVRDKNANKAAAQWVDFEVIDP